MKNIRFFALFLVLAHFMNKSQQQLLSSEGYEDEVLAVPVPLAEEKKIEQQLNTPSLLRGGAKESTEDVVVASDKSETNKEETEEEKIPAEDEIKLEKPKGWESMGYRELELCTHLECAARANDKVKTLPTMEDWKRLRDSYLKNVDPNFTFDWDIVPPTDGYNFDNGNPPPFYAAHSTRGRGVFAARDIKEGELVHAGDKPGADIVFPSAMSFRLFLFDLPRDNACDVLYWCWTQQIEKDGEYKLYMEINTSILWNSSKNDANVSPELSTSKKIYALQDIEKGEELVYDYSWYPTNYKAVGL